MLSLGHCPLFRPASLNAQEYCPDAHTSSRANPPNADNSVKFALALATTLFIGCTPNPPATKTDRELSTPTSAGHPAQPGRGDEAIDKLALHSPKIADAQLPKTPEEIEAGKDKRDEVAAAAEARRTKIELLKTEWTASRPEPIATAIKAHSLSIGMMPADVVAAWDRPLEVSRTTDASGTIEYWHYQSTPVRRATDLVFTNGLLRYISD